MPNPLVSEVVEHLEALPQNLQQQVLFWVRALDLTQPRGTAGRQLLQFAGVISNADLDAMSRAIDQGCERVMDDVYLRV